MSQALVAVDIGNTRTKFGRFDDFASSSNQLPEPVAQLALPSAGWDDAALASFLELLPTGTRWRIASVNRSTTQRLQATLGSHKFDVQLLRAADLPLTVAVPEPDKVGIDRLCGAVAANRLRQPARGAVIIGVGTAITIDRLSPRGEFLGGAILPGIGTSARAFHAFTDLLPLIPMDDLAEPPQPLGTNTIAAMRSGLYWGAVGAMRELTARLTHDDPQPPDVFLTGGAAPTVAHDLDCNARYVEHLVLAGIALANQPAA